MKLEDQVCSLELAKRLKELGFIQDSWFCWCITAPILTSSGTDHAPQWRELHLLDKYTRKKFDYIDSYSAFTVAEFGICLQWEKLYIFGCPEQLLDFVNGSDTEANARAKILIHLIENKMIDIDSLNQGWTL
jgi:hypothetical protein